MRLVSKRPQNKTMQQHTVPYIKFQQICTDFMVCVCRERALSQCHKVNVTDLWYCTKQNIISNMSINFCAVCSLTMVGPASPCGSVGSRLWTSHRTFIHYRSPRRGRMGACGALPDACYLNNIAIFVKYSNTVLLITILPSGRSYAAARGRGPYAVMIY